MTEYQRMAGLCAEVTEILQKNGYKDARAFVSSFKSYTSYMIEVDNDTTIHVRPTKKGVFGRIATVLPDNSTYTEAPALLSACAMRLIKRRVQIDELLK